MDEKLEIAAVTEYPSHLLPVAECNHKREGFIAGAKWMNEQKIMTVYVVMISYRLTCDSQTTDIFDSVHADMSSAEKRIQDITDGVGIDNQLSFIRENYLEEKEYDDPDITPFFLVKITPYPLGASLPSLR